MIDFDVILEKVCPFGKYQIIVVLALIYRGIPSGLNNIASVFLAYTPQYRCEMYPFDDRELYPNLTANEIMNITTPLDNSNKPEDQCVRYGYNLTGCTIAEDMSCVDTYADTVECSEYWFDDTLFTETVVTEFDLVCDRRILDSLGSSIYMLGLLIGAIVCGNVADRFGRKPTLVVFSFAMLLSMLGVAYCHSVELYITSRFFVALFSSGVNIAAFSHIMEIVGPNRRTLAGVGYQVFFALGYMVWSGIAYFNRDWHQMQLGALMVSAPMAIIAVVVPESPRWLFTNGRVKAGKKITVIMAKMNKVELSEVVWDEAEKAKKSPPRKQTKRSLRRSERRSSTIDLFRYSEMRKLTFKFGFCWAVTAMVYYGVSLNAGSLAGNIFLNNIYAGMLEIAFYVVCILIMDVVGRRLLLAFTSIGAGLALLSSTVVKVHAGDDEGLNNLSIALAFIGKGLAAGSVATIYNFTGELYPTVVRSNALGFHSMASRVGSLLAPFINGTQQNVPWLPNVIFGVFAICGGLLAASVRDTTGRPMMETIKEAEAFYAGNEQSRERRDSVGEEQV